MNRLIACALCLYALFAATAHGNDVVNGDFQTGSLTPSTTAYTMSSDMLPPATWNIASFDTIHPDWADFFDHTHGDATGLFMILNGTDAGIGPAWGQSISVTPSTQYKLSGWFATLFGSSPASIEFRVYDGAMLVDSSAFFTPGASADWELLQMTFNSGSASSLSVEIWDTNLQFGGNDYAVDDISLVPGVPEPATGAMLAVAAISLAPSVFRRLRYPAA